MSSLHLSLINTTSGKMYVAPPSDNVFRMNPEAQLIPCRESAETLLSCSTSSATAQIHETSGLKLSRAAVRTIYLNRRLNSYLTNEVMPGPLFLCSRIKKSKKAHKSRVQICLDNFDAIMKLYEG
jgi:hypothetical protein